MTTKIEVLPDPDVATGGHAIIRLSGVAILPPGATVRIDPIDETLADEDGWPIGEISPLATRQTEDGLELQIGPSIVDAPLLEPGVPVTVTISEAGVSAELVWPRLPISTISTDGAVVMTASQMAAEFAAAERAKADAKRLAAEADAKRERDQKSAEDAARRDAAVAAAIAAAVTIPAVERTVAPSATMGLKPAEPKPVEAKSSDAAPRKPVNGAVNGSSANAGSSNAAIEETARKLDAALLNGSRTPSSVAPATSRDIAPTAALSSLPAAKVGPVDIASPQADAAAAAPTANRTGATNGADALSQLSPKRSDSSIVITAANATPVAPVEPVDGSLPAIVVKQANEAAAKSAVLEPVAGPPAPADRRGGTMAAFFAGAALAAASLLLAVFAAPLLGVGSQPVQVAPRTVIADAFMAGPQSPRGEIAANIDLPTALRLADYNLHGVDRPIDRVEAEFWLKKAMSLTASHTQLRWALTQLGTLAAQPVQGSPDYDKARLLWEISAANGDPVALCFLGALAENGLGQPADKTRALEYYKRAKEVGGCPTSDEAIARLGR